MLWSIIAEMDKIRQELGIRSAAGIKLLLRIMQLGACVAEWQRDLRGKESYHIAGGVVYRVRKDGRITADLTED